MEEHRLPKKIYEWTPIGRKKTGRLRNTWKTKVKQAMDSSNLREEDYQDRNRCGIRPQRL
jgi:DNA-binding PadR family transcriptional regulator